MKKFNLFNFTPGEKKEIKSSFPEYLDVMKSIEHNYPKELLERLFRVFNLYNQWGKLLLCLKFIHILDYYIINKTLPYTEEDLNTLPQGKSYYGQLYGKDRKITPEHAFYWAYCIGGDRDIMIKKIHGSFWAYMWARDIGDRNIMRNKIKNSRGAYNWAVDIGDRNIMRNKIKNSKNAICWALDIGDQNIMKPIVAKSKRYTKYWNEWFPDNKIENKGGD